ncbi:MAG TPA: STAS domain-containing protein [Solirubrobacteraceae bacterium]
MTPGGLEIATEHSDGRSRIDVTGEVDLATVEKLVAAVEQGTPPDGYVELNLRGVEFMDSAGVAALNRCRRHAIDLQAEFVVLVRADSPVAQLIKWTGLDTVVDVRTE